MVTQVKTSATDGYDAVQVGYRRVRDRKLTLGNLDKAEAIPMCHLQEFRLKSVQGFEPGQRLLRGKVNFYGNTIGKGF